MNEVAELTNLSQDEFRRRLAGLHSDQPPQGASVMRGVSVRLAVMLARHYNRDALDPKALWGRIETALRSAAEKRLDDPAVMLSAMLEHVKADAASVARDNEFQAMLAELADMGSRNLESLGNYLHRAVYAVMAFARQQWEGDKKKRSGRLSVDDEAAARERGDKPSHLFPEEEVQQALADRAAMRGEEDTLD